jgi:hypothetical protein
MDGSDTLSVVRGKGQGNIMSQGKKAAIVAVIGIAAMLAAKVAIDREMAAKSRHASELIGKVAP